MTRPFRTREMPEAERPMSEQYRLLGEAWADADGAANLLEELKTTTLEQRKTAIMKERGDMAESKAERLVKSDPEWEAYIRQMCGARAAANKMKVRLEGMRMQHMEWNARDANARAEARLFGRGP